MLNKLFYFLFGIFVGLIAYIFIPFSPNLKRTLFPIAALFAIFYSILGFLLVLFSLRYKIKGNKMKFFLLTGISAIGFLISILLHNLFYSLSFFEGLFFILGIFVFPILFLIGVIGGFVSIRESKIKFKNKIKKKNNKWGRINKMGELK